MDQANRFATRTAYLLLRLEYGVATAICTVAFLLHLGEVRWWVAIALFAYIDVIGYLPGLYQHIRTGSVPKAYYVLYNVMHSFTTQGIVIGLWVLVFGFEWALLVIPIHLCGDRALFGSFIKSFEVPFEPKHPIPEFAEFEDRLVARASG